MDRKPPHTISDHDGILDVAPVGDGSRIEIAFDPSRLSEAEIRRIAREHIRPAAPGLQRCALRLDGRACEAAAAKLEQRIEKVPGVRRATATYVGRVLCLTFDAAVADRTEVLAGVRAAGAKVAPLESGAGSAHPSIWRRLRAGELNEEASCAAGLLFLIGAGIADRAGTGPLASLLYGGAYVFCGQYGVRSAIASLRERTLDVDVLMVLAAIGAAVVGAPFEGALLLFLFSFSNVLQHYALRRTQRAIESLLTLRPETAWKKTGAGVVEVAVDALVPGDIVLVRPGGSVPADGRVVEGVSTVDQSSLTGESMPVRKSVGATVFAGSMNQSGALEVAVTKRAEDSTLARMVELVAEAQAEKSHTQRFLEKAEQRYAAGVIGFTALVFLVPWLGWGEAFATAFYRAMTVMVVASPCALIVSTPATVLSAIGGAARRGILVKGGAHLEQAARIDIVAMDKTGTLTVGKPAVTDIALPGGVHPLSSGRLSVQAAQYLATCAALESRSEHPLAMAIVAAARGMALPIPAAADFLSTPGKGAEADVDGVRYVVGSERLFLELGAEGHESLQGIATELQARGRTCVWMGERHGDKVEARAIFALADTLRPEARSVVGKLREIGVRRIVMLTGDQPAVAQAIAGEAGIDEIRAGLLPEDKVRAIRELEREGTVMMVGDGVNDAPALASAHLGVAMGAAGTDVAMETADVVLMGDKLENIPLLLGMARHARRVLVQNLTFAGAVILVLVASALGLGLPLPLGVIGHEGSTVIVCLNGLRLLAYR